MSARNHEADLIANGYLPVESHGAIAIGTRVRGRGQQWPQAIRWGTGTVTFIGHKPGSAWEREWGMPDVELIVKRDEPQFGSDEMHVAQYHVATVDPSTYILPGECPKPCGCRKLSSAWACNLPADHEAECRCWRCGDAS